MQGSFQNIVPRFVMKFRTTGTNYYIIKKILTLFSILTFGTFASQAQTKNGKISGAVIDGNKKVIESATISLLKAGDSSEIKFSAASKTGAFEFINVPSGKYLVPVTAVGHTKKYSEEAEISDLRTAIILKTIELIPVPKGMAAITVTASRPFIEQKIDRTVINVEDLNTLTMWK